MRCFYLIRWCRLDFGLVDLCFVCCVVEFEFEYCGDVRVVFYVCVLVECCAKVWYDFKV